MPFSWKEIERRAIAFSKDWAGETYEKGESQSFYNDFFDIFGIKRRSVARFEEHVRKLDKKPGFIDLLWPKVLIVEHKSLGGDLGGAAGQAGDYFDALPEDVKPRFQLVCDFQQFSLLDRDAGDTVEFKLPDLHKHVRSFAFILGKQNPKHRVQEHLNLAAAELIAKIHRNLATSGYPKKDMEFFLTQLVFCLFADNTGIFQPRGLFVDLIESRTNPDGSDLGTLLSHLFQVLDIPVEKRQKTLDPDLAEFPYVDGGLFAERVSIPSLNAAVRKDLLIACGFDWSEMSPAIFGSLFQSVLTAEERRDIGGFATSEKNIMKVVDDLFLTALRRGFDELLLPGARRIEKLKAFRRRLSELKFLDPACGCGNFLAVAYREIRKLELEALVALDRLGELKDERAKRSVVDVDQFFGIENRSYSARIAETAMWMTDHIANNELSLALNVDFHRVPLAKSAKIIVEDALDIDWSSVIPPDACSYVLGNPPYKGPKQQNEAERRQIRKIARLGASGGTLDYACGWIITAAKYAEAGVRVGLVTTNSVVQGEQTGQLWPVLYDRFSLEIVFAHQPFQWHSESRGRSQVQVVITGLVRKTDAAVKKRLYQYATATAEPVIAECDSISPYLIVGDNLVDPHIVVRKATSPVNGLRELKTGAKPIDGGYYILSESEKRELVREEPGAAKFIRPFIGTDEFLYGELRYILVLCGASPIELKALPKVMGLVRKVSEYRKAQICSKDGKRQPKKPTQEKRPPTLFHFPTKLEDFPQRPFLIVPEVTSERRKYVPIGWLEPPTIPSNLVKYLENATLYEFALLTSAMHMAWLKSIGGHLEGRNRYSIGVVYNTFPIAEGLDTERLSRAAQAVLDAREEEARKGCTLAAMYDKYLMPAALRRAHEALDNEVDRQYLGKVADNDQVRVVNLLNRYHALRHAL